MHPLKMHLNSLREAAPDYQTYRKAVLRLAAKIGVHNKLFNNIMNPNQKTSELAPLKALRMELYTKGDVLALSVCPKLHERIEEARRIAGMAERLNY